MQPISGVRATFIPISAATAIRLLFFLDRMLLLFDWLLNHLRLIGDFNQIKIQIDLISIRNGQPWEIMQSILTFPMLILLQLGHRVLFLRHCTYHWRTMSQVHLPWQLLPDGVV